MTTATASRGVTLADAIGDGLDQAMASDPDVVIIGEDVGRLGGVFRITRGLQDRYGSERVIDAPLSEAAIVGAAIGMALNGLRPIVEIQFDGFIFPALNQVCCHLARYATRGKLDGLPVVIRIPVGGRFQAAELHAENPETYFAHTAGLRVVSLSDVRTARALVLAAVASRSACIVLEPKRLYRTERITPDEAEPAVAIDRARTVVAGGDATIITYGPSLPLALSASRRLAAEGHAVGVVDLVSLAPLDEAAILAVARETGRVVVLTEASRPCSIASEVVSLLATDAFDALKASPRIVASPHQPQPPSAFQGEFFPDEDQVVDAVRAVL